jgi:hypothetical protein
MKLLVLITYFISYGLLADGIPEFKVHSNEANTIHIVTLLGNEESAQNLIEPWYEKANQLCRFGILKIEPSEPIVRNRGCGDAIEMVNGHQQCEVIRANVFGKVVCNAT